MELNTKGNIVGILFPNVFRFPSILFSRSINYFLLFLTLNSLATRIHILLIYLLSCSHMRVTLLILNFHRLICLSSPDNTYCNDESSTTQPPIAHDASSSSHDSFGFQHHLDGVRQLPNISMLTSSMLLLPCSMSFLHTERTNLIFSHSWL